MLSSALLFLVGVALKKRLLVEASKKKSQIGNDAIIKRQCNISRNKFPLFQTFFSLLKGFRHLQNPNRILFDICKNEKKTMKNKIYNLCFKIIHRKLHKLPNYLPNVTLLFKR